ALAAAFLGSTTIKPGRVNALGTVLGVFITTVGISGLQQILPGQFFLEPLFNGLTLIAAITIASMASRQRLARADAKFTTTAPPPTTPPQSSSSPAETSMVDAPAGAQGKEN
ncbi:MAG TPA: hypothetical protein DEH05_01525, partial [Propionibacteriaceae bacterium]|nr:hypothetical protein [Propionibacteriaceae bacterium]